MCHYSAPLSLTPSEVWVLAECDTSGETYAIRLAICEERQAYVLLPSNMFEVHGLLPLYPETGEPIPGIRWADLTDLDRHPVQLLDH